MMGAAKATDFSFQKDYVDTNYGGNGKPGWVKAGDMDGDGDTDIAAGGGGVLYIYENTGSGWSRHGSYGNPGCNSAELYDVDVDGDLDVICAMYNRDLSWWENPGTLGKGTWTRHAFAGNNSFLHDTLRVDIDQDGTAAELLCVTQSGYWNCPWTIRWYRIKATGTWESHTVASSHPGPNNNHSGIDVGDLDEDGDLDIAFSNGWFESPGDPTGTWTWHSVCNIYGISNNKARDIDNDGDIDLVMSAGHHGQGCYWFENNGNASSWTQHNISAVHGSIIARTRYNASADYLHHPEGLQVLDLDGDGDQDVIVSELFFGEDSGEPAWSDQRHNWYVYENLGDGLSWREQNMAPNSYASHQLQIADVNQDGKMDVISEGCGYKIVAYYENRTQGTGGQVRITNATDESRSCYKIETTNATYYYNKAGGGFTSILDRSGVDWVQFHPKGGSDGAYRGIPNMARFWKPYFNDTDSTTDDPLDTWLPKVTVHSAREGWSGTAEFHPTYVKMTLHTTPTPSVTYWFLYEGTPGGAVDGNDRIHLSNGRNYSCNDDHPWKSSKPAPNNFEDITNTSRAAPGMEWVFFAASEMNRSMFYVHKDDQLEDDYWQMNNDMTVFGFGRTDRNGVLMTGDDTLYIGFVESREYDTVKRVIHAVAGGPPSAAGKTWRTSFQFP